MTRRDLSRIAEELRALLERVPASPEGLTSRQANDLRQQLEHVVAELKAKAAALDPTREPDSFFDPSDPRLFGVFAAIALVGQERVRLTAISDPRFYGSGVYAIYYRGGFEAYAPITRSEHPIYVGKAEPAASGARTPKDQDTRLHRRLSEHQKTIASATRSLRVEDFDCRYLVVQSGWEGAAETALINLFHPVWNKESRILYGFGKHGDAAETRGNKRSPWDTLHPGREWAGHDKLEDARPLRQIRQDIADHFARHAVVRDVEGVVRQLLATIQVNRP